MIMNIYIYFILWVFIHTEIKLEIQQMLKMTRFCFVQLKRLDWSLFF